MKLINVETYELHEFFEVIPQYAVLSHTWDEPDNEVTYADLALEGLTKDVEAKPGFRKLNFALHQAQREGLRWLWVDTCCVDRSSSADVGEAVIAAWEWFANSTSCYVYLSDAPANNDPTSKGFLSAQWFRRSWTLPELLAPENISFYTEDWTQVGIGTMRTDLGLQEAVFFITKIPREALTGQLEVGEFSIAQRLSWASTRRCRRAEDATYSLFGLFDVSMPLLYGEGRRAFVRFQELLLKDYPEDQSLFAWTVPISSPRVLTIGSIWAESPEDFASSANVKCFPNEMSDLGARTTRRGVLIDLYIRGDIQFRDTLHINYKSKLFHAKIASLNCGPDDGSGQRVVIPLISSHLEENNDTRRKSYCRVVVPRLELRNRMSDEASRRLFQPLLICNALALEDRRFAQGGIHIQNVPLKSHPSARDGSTEPIMGYSIVETIVPGTWAKWSSHYNSIQFATPGPPYMAGTLDTPAILGFSNNSSRLSFNLVIGFTSEVAYCGLRHWDREPIREADYADAAAEILRKGPQTHCLDYAYRAGDIAEDELRWDHAELVVKVKMRRETVGSVASGAEDLREHYVVAFTFTLLKPEGSTSSSLRRFGFKS